MQRSDLRSYVRTRMRLDTADYPDATIDELLNEALNQTATVFTWPWLEGDPVHTFDSADATPSYTAPADYWRILAVVETASTVNLRFLPWREIRRRTGGDLDYHSGNPVVWSLYQDKIYLLPEPSSVINYTVDYLLKPAFAAGDTALPPFEAAFHLALAWWAMAEIWEEEEDMERSDFYRNKWANRVSEMAIFYNLQPADQPLIYGESADRTAYKGPSFRPFQPV
jgi:hypothetical protein